MVQEKNNPFANKRTFAKKRISDQAIKIWLQEKNSGDQGSGSASLLKNWMRGDRQRIEAVRELKAFLNSSELHAALEEVSAAEDTLVSVQRSRRGGWQRWAAAVVLLFVLPAAFLFFQAPAGDFNTAVGEQRQNTLADGSTVFLNTDSSLKVSFEPGIRRVRLLKGEAMFDITPDSDRPFVVEMDRRTLIVTGTRFVARINEGIEEVQMLEGTVRLGFREDLGGPETLLHAGNHAIDETGNPVRVNTLGHPPGWLEGHLVFEAALLSDAVNEIDRYLPGAILIVGSAIKSKRLTATYHLDQIEQVPDVIAETLGFGIQRLGPVTIFY